MPKRRVAGPGRMGSTSAVKKQNKSSKPSNIRFIPKEGETLTVRFLSDPADFHGFYQHYSDSGGYFPCWGGECCQMSDARSFRYLANAFVFDDNQVRAVSLPTSLVDQLVGYYEKNGTLMDRDYDLYRTGTGKNDTKYMSQPDAPQKMNLSRYKNKMLDLDDVLQAELDALDSDGDDDDDDEEIPRRRKRTSPRRSDHRDPWEDDDDDDEDEPPRRRTAGKRTKGVAKKRKYTPSGLDEFADDDDDEETPRRRVTARPSKTRSARTSTTRRVKRTRR